MDLGSIARLITETFDGVFVMQAAGDTFFIYDPAGDLPDNRKMPFATLVTGDRYDTVSCLDRDEETFRLNIGLPKAGYAALLGPGAGRPEPPTVDDSTDVVMPHPVHAGQHWVCVINPGPATDAALPGLLEQAHDFAVRKHERHEARQGSR